MPIGYSAPGAPTAKDNAVAGDVHELKKLHLRQPEIKRRFRRVAQYRTGHIPYWGPNPAAWYWSELERICQCLDRIWTTSELARLTADPSTLEDRIAGRRGIGIGFVAGRAGTSARQVHPRQISPFWIELVARAHALRCTGLTSGQANQAAADEANARRAASYRIPANTVGVYRKRLRDRLG